MKFLDFIYFSLVFYGLYRQYWSICSILALKMLRLMKLKLSVTNNFKIYTIPPGQLRHHPPLDCYIYRTVFSRLKLQVFTKRSLMYVEQLWWFLWFYLNNNLEYMLCSAAFSEEYCSWHWRACCSKLETNGNMLFVCSCSCYNIWFFFIYFLD